MKKAAPFGTAYRLSVGPYGPSVRLVIYAAPHGAAFLTSISDLHLRSPPSMVD